MTQHEKARLMYTKYIYFTYDYQNLQAASDSLLGSSNGYYGKASLMVIMYIVKAIWMPKSGEILQCEQERGNLEDLYAVIMIKD